MTEPLTPFWRLDYQTSFDRPLLSLPGGNPDAVLATVHIERRDIARAMPHETLRPPHGASAIPHAPNWASQQAFSEMHRAHAGNDR